MQHHPRLSDYKTLILSPQTSTYLLESLIYYIKMKMFKTENGERMKILQIQRLIRKVGLHL